MTSTSTDGLSTITLAVLARSQHRRGGAGRPVGDCRCSAIAAAHRCPTPPTQRKVNPADAPILNIVLSSTTLPLSTVDEYAENLLAQQISTVSGVAQVQVYGSQQYAVRIQLDPERAGDARHRADRGRASRSATATSICPPARSTARDKATSMQATGQLMNAQAYGPMIVAYRNGAPVRLNEIGRVFDSVQNDKIAAWHNGTRGIMLAVQRQPGTNTIEIVDAVKKILPTFESQLPPAIKLNVFYRPFGLDPRGGARRPGVAVARAGPRRSRDLRFPAQRFRQRSFPAWHCRCRSWARLRSCMRSATASTTCR